MASVGVFTLSTLAKALGEQGFEVKPTSDGYRVLAPDGVGTSELHASVFKTEHAHNYRNQMASLRRIGFDYDRAANGNGSSDTWRAERDAIEVMITESQTAAEAKAAADAEAQASADERASRLANLTRIQREALDVITAEPGLAPRDYAARVHCSIQTFSARLRPLFDHGLIVGVGKTSGRRVFPADAAHATAGMVSTAGKPSAGPVRTRHIEPEDATVRFRRMGERASKLKADLESIIAAMVEQYDAQEKELAASKAKVKRLEHILGKAVDAL